MTNTRMPTGAPARKVKGATVGAGAGVVLSNLVLWGLDDFVFDPKAPDSVPGPVSAAVVLLVPAALAFVGGYITRRHPAELDPAPNQD